MANIVIGGGKQTLSLNVGDTYTQYEVWIEFEDGTEGCWDIHTNPRGARNNLKSSLTCSLEWYYRSLAGNEVPRTARPVRSYIKQVQCVATSANIIATCDRKDQHQKAVDNLTKKDYSGSSIASLFKLDMTKVPTP